MSVWILTSEYNDYDQHGEYFEAVWSSKPTEQQLADAGVWPSDSKFRHVLAGGGRVSLEGKWWHLREVEL